MRKHLFLLVIILGISGVATTQNSMDTLLASISSRFLDHPSELVYVQTNKGIYETGEDLWFKAYQLDAQSYGLSGRSQTLYLQMINNRDSVVWQEKYPVTGGIAEGHVYIDENLSEGTYFLGAYTRHSFLKDTAGIWPGRKIRIIKNIAHANDTIIPKEKSGLKFGLFAEGGNAVAGLPCRMSFKATDGKGYPVEVEGKLFEDERAVTTFKSMHDGMGSFSFTPSADKTYRVELTNGSRYSLPAIYPEGISLRLIRQNGKEVEFLVSQTPGIAAGEIYLLGQMRGMICCVAKGVLKDKLKIKIPVSEFLYQGIAEFTLFDATMQPVAERLVYIHPKKKLSVRIEPEKKRYGLREKATLKIKVTDDTGSPVRAHLGVSVFDEAYLNPADPVNILTHCYLSSQIGGVIHNPAYYFDEENKDRKEALDLLLLTQGWRRYIWGFENPAYTGEMFLPDEISGIQHIESKKKGRAIGSGEQLIQVSGAEGGSQFVWADSAGCFTVGTDRMKELRGGYIYLKPMLSKEFKPELEITDYFAVIDSVRKKKHSYYPVADLAQRMKDRLPDMPVVSSDSTILLDEVVITRKGRKPFRDKFMGRLDSLAQMDLNKTWVCKCSPMYLNDYYSGYTHHPNSNYDGERLKPVIGKSYRAVKYNPEMVVEDIKENVIYEGVRYSEEELLRMNNLWRTKGYYAAREFYQPDELDMQFSTPDARNALLWLPSVVTDEKGEATVSFYCSDINTLFTGIVEGTDGAGLLGTGKCEFRVMRDSR